EKQAKPERVDTKVFGQSSAYPANDTVLTFKLTRRIFVHAAILLALGLRSRSADRRRAISYRVQVKPSIEVYGRCCPRVSLLLRLRPPARRNLRERAQGCASYGVRRSQRGRGGDGNRQTARSTCSVTATKITVASTRKINSVRLPMPLRMTSYLSAML